MSDYQTETLDTGDAVLHVYAGTKIASFYIALINSDSKATIRADFDDPDRRDDFYRFLLRAARKIGETLGEPS